jgi:hypothetical protein
MNASVTAAPPIEALDSGRSTACKQSDSGFLSLLTTAADGRAQVDGSHFADGARLSPERSAKDGASAKRSTAAKKEDEGEARNRGHGRVSDSITAANAIGSQVTAVFAQAPFAAGPSLDPALNDVNGGSEAACGRGVVAEHNEKPSCTGAELVPDFSVSAERVEGDVLPSGSKTVSKRTENAEAVDPTIVLPQEESGATDDNCFIGRTVERVTQSQASRPTVTNLEGSATAHKVPSIDDRAFSASPRNVDRQGEPVTGKLYHPTDPTRLAGAETSIENSMVPPAWSFSGTGSLDAPANVSFTAAGSTSLPMSASQEAIGEGQPSFVKPARIAGNDSVSTDCPDVAGPLPANNAVQPISGTTSADSAVEGSFAWPDTDDALDTAAKARARFPEKETDTSNVATLQTTALNGAVLSGRLSHSNAPSQSGEPPARVDAGASATIAPQLHAAQLLQRMNKSELRIGLETEYFGNIQLHTTVARDQVAAAVSTSHTSLRDALLAEAPSLERAMARQNLRLDSVSVGTSNSDGRNFNSFGNNGRNPAHSGPARYLSRSADESRVSASSPPASFLEGAAGLDVRA